MEDYLKAIWKLQRAGGATTTSALASELSVSAASATAMVKKLAARGFVDHAPYRGVTLTTTGERVALETVRHHRLLERFLVEVLGVPWDEVHDEAEKWEHVLSEELEERIDAALGFPARDPHGAPIPRADGGFAGSPTTTLAELEAGNRALLAEVSDHDPAMLRYLGELGLYPGARIEVVSSAPFDGPLAILVGDAERVVGRELARHVLVEEVRP